MRIRLRAPDDECATPSTQPARMGHTSPVRLVAQPPLDVRSPEYIVERLENLKRRPTLIQWLDRYVELHPESSSSEEESDEETDEKDQMSTSVDVHAARCGAPGFVSTFLWSMLVVALTPLWILLLPWLRYKHHGWPLQCSSLQELYRKALWQLAYTAFALVLLYWSISREFPAWNTQELMLSMAAQAQELRNRSVTCLNSIEQAELMPVIQLQCAPIALDYLLIAVQAVLLVHCHRTWARTLLVIAAIAFGLDAPQHLLSRLLPAPEIVSVEPSYALLDEEILLSLEGQHLEPGSEIGWVPYWGCATTSSIEDCEKQFVHTLDVGTVSVRFTSIDHFIPCYREPLDPSIVRERSFRCFDHVRVRVKDKRSIPGWSLTERATSTRSTGTTEPRRRTNTRTVEVDAFSGAHEEAAKQSRKHTDRMSYSEEETQHPTSAKEGTSLLTSEPTVS